MMIINKILRVKTVYMQKCFIKHINAYLQMLLAFFDTERQIIVISICSQYIEACPKATTLQKFSNSYSWKHFLKSILIQISSLFVRAKLTISGSGNGLAPSRQQCITWAIYDTVHWCIMHHMVSLRKQLNTE